MTIIFPYRNANSTSYEASSKKLTRSDFKRINLKGEGRKYYFSYEDLSGYELTLEPCFSGFCVGFYKGLVLISDKICTGLKELVWKEEEEEYRKNPGSKSSFEKFMMKEIMFGTQERSELAWEKALAIANQIWTRHKNEERLKRWRLIEEDMKTEESDPLIKPPYPNFPPYPTYLQRNSTYWGSYNSDGTSNSQSFSTT